MTNRIVLLGLAAFGAGLVVRAVSTSEPAASTEVAFVAVKAPVTRTAQSCEPPAELAEAAGDAHPGALSDPCDVRVEHADATPDPSFLSSTRR